MSDTLLQAELLLLLVLLARAMWARHWARGAERALAAGQKFVAEARYRRVLPTARLLVLPAVERAAAHRLSGLLGAHGRLDEAAAVLERALGWRPGWPRPRLLAILHNDLAVLRSRQRRDAEAEREFAAAERHWSGSARDRSFAVTLENHAAFLHSRGRARDAVAARRRALEVRESLYPRDPAAEQRARRQLAVELAGAGEAAAAEAEWMQLQSDLVHDPAQVGGEATDLRLEALQALVELCDRQGRQPDSDRWFALWVELLRARPDISAAALARAQLVHGERQLRAAAAGEAETSARRALADLPDSAPGLRLWAHHLSARARAAQQDWSGAAAACTDALALAPTEDDDGGPRRFELMVLLADVRAKTWDLPAAESAYREALAYLEPRVAPGHPWLQWAQVQLARLRHGGPAGPVH